MRNFSKAQQTKQLIWRKKSYLTNHIDQVEELTEEELGSIPVVLRSVPVFLRSVGRDVKVMMSTVHDIEKSKNLNIHNNETFQWIFFCDFMC